MPAAIKCQSILTPSGSEPGILLTADDGTIDAIGAALEVPAGVRVIELPNATLVPGFIDIHVHGGGGFSLATSDPEEIRNYARWVVSHGVTSFLPTICAGGITEGLEFVRTAAQATGQVDGGANVLGVNLEGPFVSDEMRGALPKAWLRGFEPALLKIFADTAEGQLRLITIAPEVDVNERLLSQALARGAKVSIGHSNASSDTAKIAFNYGATHITHLFNAMRPFHHREPGIVGAAYDHSDVTMEMIADGVHLDPTTVAIIVRLFGADRITLVSDAVPPAGSDYGEFRLGQEVARLVGDRVLLDDGTISGGAETMDHIVRNVIWWQAADLADAACMASSVPARVIGLGDRKGRIAPGFDADLVALDPQLNVVMTWVHGRVVYSRAYPAR